MLLPAPMNSRRDGEKAPDPHNDLTGCAFELEA
jgi:hypothetical protein